MKDSIELLLQFLLGICLGIFIGVLILAVSMDKNYQKFCPQCGRHFKNEEIYCPSDGVELLMRKVARKNEK